MLKSNKIFIPIFAISTIAATAIPLTICMSCNRKIGGDQKPLTDLCFSDVEGNGASEVWYMTNITDDSIEIQYSFDSINWNPWNVESDLASKHITLDVNDDNPNNDRIYVRNTKNVLSNGDDRAFLFQMSGKIAASGNVNSMINYAELTDYCFMQLFSNCTSLTKAPELPATTLANGCYRSMFYNCSSLDIRDNGTQSGNKYKIFTFPSDLTEPNYYCKDMFYNCKGQGDLVVTRGTSYYCYYTE